MTRTTKILLSIITPFLLESIFNSIDIYFFQSRGRDIAVWIYMAISVICGYLFLFNEFKKLRIVIAIFYLPAMYLLLFFYTAVFAVIISGVIAGWA